MDSNSSLSYSIPVSSVDWLTLIVLALTLCAIVWYTIETVKLRRINYSILQLEQARLAPSVHAYFDNGNSAYFILLKIVNLGGSPAKDIKLQIEPHFKMSEDQIDGYFERNAVFHNGLSILLPSKEYVIFAGATTNSSEPYKAGRLPRTYTFTVSFNDESGKKYVNRQSQNLDHLFDRIDPYDKTELEKQLEQINKTIKEQLIKSVYSLTDAITKK